MERRGGVCLVLCGLKSFHCLFFFLQDALKGEICNLKKTVEGSEIQREELQVEFLPSDLESNQTGCSGLRLI